MLSTREVSTAVVQQGWTEGKELQPYSGIINRLAEMSRWIRSLMGFVRALLVAVGTSGVRETKGPELMGSLLGEGGR